MAVVLGQRFHFRRFSLLILLLNKVNYNQKSEGYNNEI
jgi:hypothetical protein